MRARAFTCTGVSATGLPWVSSTTPCTDSFWLTDTQLAARMPATTADGHTGTVWRSVWISPFGSAKPASSTRSPGVVIFGMSLTVTLPLPSLSSVTGSLSATSFSRLSPDVSSLSSSSTVARSSCARGGWNENSSKSAKLTGFSRSSADRRTGRPAAPPPFR
ncbi:hypothetical protein D3C87_1124860 [compost metagenome]